MWYETDLSTTPYLGRAECKGMWRSGQDYPSGCGFISLKEEMQNSAKIALRKKLTCSQSLLFFLVMNGNLFFWFLFCILVEYTIYPLLGLHFKGIKYIYIVTSPSPRSISRTLSSQIETLPIKLSLPIPTTSPWQPPFYFVSVNSTTLDTSYRWNRDHICPFMVVSFPIA